MTVLDGMPPEYLDAAREARDDLWRMVDQARLLEKDGDLPALRRLAEQARRRIELGCDRTGNFLRSKLSDVTDALVELYDRVFPLTDPADPLDVLDGPWPTPARSAALASIVDYGGWLPPPREPLVDRAIAAGDVRMLRLLLLTPLGSIERDTAARVFDALHAHGALDAEVVEQALYADSYIGNAVIGRNPRDGRISLPPAASEAAVRDLFDALIWRLTGPGLSVEWDALPKAMPLRGLRFVLRALRWEGDPRLAGYLGSAELTEEDRAGLVAHLADRPEQDRRRAFDMRLREGDAWALLPLIGLDGAQRLMLLVQGMSTMDSTRRWDRSRILAAVAEAGEDGARRLLELRPSEAVSAAMGWNRAEVEKRVRHNALDGIAAYGLLPLADGETVLQRYLALREVAKRGAKLGPNRRHSHAEAVEVAIHHLAQVAGAPDAGRLEWDCEARIAAEVPDEWQLAGYTVALRLDGAEPTVTVARSGRQLKSVPAPVRADPGYSEVRQHQEQLRDQARRMRTGLVERLVATAGSLTPDELARLRTLPAGAAMLPALLWRDGSGRIGLLDDVDTIGPVTAVHPFELYQRDLLAHWQAEIVRRRVRQPVKQAFRELYLLTPAERDAVDVSRRYAGHTVDGKVAAQLLSVRGWSTNGEYADYQATRRLAPGLTAGLRCTLHGYFGLGDAVIGELSFQADGATDGTAGRTTGDRTGGGAAVPLADVPPEAFSEVMRDLDLVVSQAGTHPDGYGSPSQAQGRAQLLAALIEDLGLERVTIAGATAVVRGSRATYRVHLNSGSIHVVPGGYLCIVPASFGAAPHRRLFLPFADEDRMTSIVLSKVLLLAEDEKITDETILRQLG